MTVTVRAAGSADRPAIGRMLHELLDYLDAIEPSPRPDGLLDRLLDQAFGPDPVCAMLIAEREGEPVGYVGYHPGVWEIFRALYVISLCVRPQARGEGVGRALMEAVKAVAREARAERVIWEVWRENPEAVGFYRAIGGQIHEDNHRMSLVVQ